MTSIDLCEKLLWKETLTIMKLENKRQINIFFLKAKLYTPKFKYNSPVSMVFFSENHSHHHKRNFKSKLWHDMKGVWLNVML